MMEEEWRSDERVMEEEWRSTRSSDWNSAVALKRFTQCCLSLASDAVCVRERVCIC